MDSLRTAVVASCELTRTADYSEQIAFRVLPAIRNAVDVTITSTLATARDPRAPRVRYQAVLKVESLRRLSHSLQLFLRSIGALRAEAGPTLGRKSSHVTELIAQLPWRTSDPQIAQLIMLDALEKYSRNAAAVDVDEFNRSDMAQAIPGDVMKRVGSELNTVVRQFIGRMNSRSMWDHLRTQERVNRYIELLHAHDWTQPISEEIARMRDAIDPDERIMEGHRNDRTTH